MLNVMILFRFQIPMYLGSTAFDHQLMLTLEFLIAVPGRLINFQKFYGQEGPYLLILEKNAARTFIRVRTLINFEMTFWQEIY